MADGVGSLRGWECFIELAARRPSSFFDVHVLWEILYIRVVPKKNRHSIIITTIKDHQRTMKWGGICRSGRSHHTIYFPTFAEKNSRGVFQV